MQPKALQDPKRRKMLIYAGVAGALLLVVMLARRGSSSAAAATQPTATPVSNPAVDPSSYYSGGSGSGGTGAGGVDYGPQLSTLDTDVNTLAQAVQANQVAAQTPGVSTPAAGTVDTSAGSNFSDLVGAVTAGSSIFAAGLAAGAQKQPGPGNTKAAPPKPKPRAKPHPTTRPHTAPPPRRPTSRAAKRHG